MYIKNALVFFCKKVFRFFYHQKGLSYLCQVLKMYAWEKSFEERIEEIRAKELSVLKEIAVLKAISFFLSMCTPFLVSFFCN